MKSVFDTAQAKDGRAFLKIIGPQARVTSLRKLERRKRVLAGLRKIVMPRVTREVAVPGYSITTERMGKGGLLKQCEIVFRKAYTRLFELHPTKGWRSTHLTA